MSKYWWCVCTTFMTCVVIDVALGGHCRWRWSSCDNKVEWGIWRCWWSWRKIFSISYFRRTADEASWSASVSQLLCYSLYRHFVYILKSNTSIYLFREVWLTHCRPRHTNADTHMKGCYNNLITHVISFLPEMHEIESAFVAGMQTYPIVLNAIIWYLASQLMK